MFYLLFDIDCIDVVVFFGWEYRQKERVSIENASPMVKDIVEFDRSFFLRIMNN